MDNDLKILRFIKSSIKEGLARIQCPKYRKLLSIEEGNALITKAISDGGPFIAGRFGSNEARVTSKFLHERPYSDEEVYRITTHAGVFPSGKGDIDNFARINFEACQQVDLLGVWFPRGEADLIKSRKDSSLGLAPLRCLEPYYSDQPWSKALGGKKVLVVHPFKESICNQYARRASLFDNDLLPEFQKLTVVQAYQTLAGEISEFETWTAALESMQEQIAEADFEVAIIGAGAYGLPLAAHVKNLGKVAIHMGGATQLLFGIKGARWNDHPVIGKLYNESWSSPMAHETPAKKELVEGGSYW